MADLPTLRRRRGTVKASITKLTTKVVSEPDPRTKVAELEARDSDPSVIGHAQQLLKQLETLDANFKTHQLAIIDIQEEGQLGAEQETLDKHDDDVTELSVRLQALSVPRYKRQLPLALPYSLIELSLSAAWRSCKQGSQPSMHGDVRRLTGDPSEVYTSGLSLSGTVI